MADYMAMIRNATHVQIDTLGEDVVLDCGAKVKAIFDYPAKFSRNGSVELNLLMPTIFIKDDDFYPDLKKLQARNQVFFVDRTLPDGAGAIEIRIVENKSNDVPKHVFGGFG